MAGRSSSPLDTTLIETLEEAPAESGDPRTSLAALVLLWSRDEPERVGEVVCLPPGGRDRTYTIGRADQADDDGAIPLTFGQARPRGRVERGPLRAAHVSRRQLAIAHEGGGGLRIEQVGRGVLRLDGHPLSSGVIYPGGLIEVENRITLLYSRRPMSWMRPVPGDITPEFPFGAADRWGLVGESPAAWELRRQAAFLAARDEHALILGPSGCGKELIVQAIHGLSARGRAPLCARNAATIPETLIDAELFGNLRNYPNPGMPERQGLLGEADGSTLFLDEVGELPRQLQAHLLRVMDRGEYQRLGEPRVRRADLRILAATNRDPAELKHDFLARFPHRLTIPGLDERPEDVPLLARHLLRGIAASDPGLVAPILRGDEPLLSAELAAALATYRYTTNVRELSELLWRALHASQGGPALEAPAELVRLGRPRPEAVEPTPAPGTLTRESVLAILERCGGVKEVAWRELGLRNRYQLGRLLKKLGIE
ncbi:MAG: sigma-54-dependent Fis family transcriptional regulator [Myxococcales bacterium]|nr:sigma-54-dependent Fis family transcriptional regulator [Myxococcales bacterium]